LWTPGRGLRQADELLDELRWFGRPVRWVINSHWHFDHVFGNQRFVERAGGGIARVEAVDVSADLELWGHADLPAMLLDNDAELRATLRDFYGDGSMTTCSTSGTGGGS
jgi:glyoxylase-like metal-dependent hydrolase (beta-lactamase superfamily II)